MSNFQVDMICIDNAGYQFLDSCNESDLFKDAGINLKFINFDSIKEGIDYSKEIRKLKLERNLENHKICFKQNFTSEFIRKANEHLQACIDHKKIWFASRATAHGTQFDRISTSKIPLKETGHDTILDLIEFQDSWVYQTKKQCSLVEHKATSRGSQNFDLPQHLKRSNSPNKARKDNYSSLMLANWGLKLYNDITKAEINTNKETFEPVMLF